MHHRVSPSVLGVFLGAVPNQIASEKPVVILRTFVQRRSAVIVDQIDLFGGHFVHQNRRDVRFLVGTSEMQRRFAEFIRRR